MKRREPFNSFVIPMFISIFASGALSACSMTKDMSEMHDTTNKMADTTTHMDAITTHMDETTTGMSDKTNKMLDRMEHMDATSRDMYTNMQFLYGDDRQSMAANMRRDAIVKAMASTKSLESKMGYAAIYYSSFEFQVWKDFAGDDFSKREKLFGDAAEEFFRTIRPYINDLGDVSPLALTDKHKDLLAFAAALWKVNPNQIDRGEAQNFAPASMESIIKEGLDKRAAVNMGQIPLDRVPRYLIEVQSHEPVAVHLLQLEHNILMASILAKMAGVDMDNITNVDQAKNLARQIIHVVAKGELDLATSNVATLGEFVRFLKVSAETRSFLKSHGYGVQVSTMVSEGYRHIKLAAHVENLTGADPREKNLKLKLIASINELVQKLNKD